MNTYKHQSIRELADQQVRFAPPAKRLEQLKRGEQLLNEIEPAREYPYQFICYRLTEFRSDAHAGLVMKGQDVLHDLGLLINDLATSLPAVPVEEVPEEVMTTDEISRRLNVSTKTINRWRKRGLIGIPVLSNGKRQMGFLPSLVDPFLEANKDRFERSAKFTLLEQQEKDDILRRARRFARVGLGSLTEISRRIARRLHRSPETVRYTIKNFDREHPEHAIFPEMTGPIERTDKHVIVNSFRRGMDVNTIAKNFQRDRSMVYRAVNEIRAQRLFDQHIEWVYNECFDDPSQEAAIRAEMPDAEAFEEDRRAKRIPKDAPPELFSNYEMPLLTKDQEQHLFRKMNFLKYHAAKKLETLKLPSGLVNTALVRVELLDAIEADLAEANKIKELLIRCNMRLVTSVAKKHSGQTDNFFELLSDGNISLMRAVEKFDYFRGNKFSTYATWSLIKNFARSIPDEIHRKERFVTGNEEVFDATEDKRTNEKECLAAAEHASVKVNRLLEYLEPREREIVRLRAGLDDAKEALTLEKIGEKLGITKERVRQLNVKAMKKLRSIAEFDREGV